MYIQVQPKSFLIQFYKRLEKFGNKEYKEKNSHTTEFQGYFALFQLEFWTI